MWLVLGLVSTGEACLNELTAAEKRWIAEQKAQEDAEIARLRAEAEAERAAELARREAVQRERLAVEARLRAEREADAAHRERWGTTGAAVGFGGATLCAAFTAFFAVRVERAGGRREVRYS